MKKFTNASEWMHMENDNFAMNVKISNLPVSKCAIKTIVENIKDCFYPDENIKQLINYIDDRILENDIILENAIDLDDPKNKRAYNLRKRLHKNKEYVLEYDRKIKNIY